MTNDGKHSVEHRKIIIHNSSFGSLDLRTGSKAQITECYIDANSNTRPTLITANNSNVSILNCQFEKFTNENDSTILHGSGNSYVAIDNSVFIHHNSSGGILFLEQNCSLSVNNSLISQNIASSHGYSAITLREGIYADIRNSVFESNSALMGGAVNAEHQCYLQITNCTFSRNKAMGLRGSGGAIFLVRQVELFLSSCKFEANFADGSGGTVAGLTKVNIEIKDTIFKRNKASHHGGVFNGEDQVKLLVTNCVLEVNTAHEFGGTLSCLNKTKVDIRNTTFKGNSASKGGAVNVENWSHLSVILCTFEYNQAQKFGGAVSARWSTIVEIRFTNFSGK